MSEYVFHGEMMETALSELCRVLSMADVGRAELRVDRVALESLRSHLNHKAAREDPWDGKVLDIGMELHMHDVRLLLLPPGPIAEPLRREIDGEAKSLTDELMLAWRKQT